jgi:hypothetical protein
MVVLTGSFLLIFFNKVHFAYNHLKCLSKKGFRMSKKYWVQSFNLTKRTVGHARILCACQGNYNDIQIWVWNFDGAFVKQSTAKSNFYLEAWSTQEPKSLAIHGCVTLLLKFLMVLKIILINKQSKVAANKNFYSTFYLKLRVKI